MPPLSFQIPEQTDTVCPSRQNFACAQHLHMGSIPNVFNSVSKILGLSVNLIHPVYLGKRPFAVSSGKPTITHTSRPGRVLTANKARKKITVLRFIHILYDPLSQQ